MQKDDDKTNCSIELNNDSNFILVVMEVICTSETLWASNCKMSKITHYSVNSVIEVNGAVPTWNLQKKFDPNHKEMFQNAVPNILCMQSKHKICGHVEKWKQKN